jgi:hypothetical protein
MQEVAIVQVHPGQGKKKKKESQEDTISKNKFGVVLHVYNSYLTAGLWSEVSAGKNETLPEK